MIRFGPAGNCDRFYEEGNKASAQAPAWIAAQGLNAYEYAAGHGVALKEETARQIGEAAHENGIAVSIHAPYYINCGSPEEEKQLSSIDYLLKSARAIDWIGGNRVIFHVGSPGKRRREAAFEEACKVVRAARIALDEAGLMSHADRGKAHLRRVSAKGSSEFALRALLAGPEKWFSGGMLDWIREAENAAG